MTSLSLSLSLPTHVVVINITVGIAETRTVLFLLSFPVRRNVVVMTRGSHHSILVNFTNCFLCLRVLSCKIGRLQQGGFMCLRVSEGDLNAKALTNVCKLRSCQSVSVIKKVIKTLVRNRADAVTGKIFY